jgi:hypothetical protein
MYITIYSNNSEYIGGRIVNRAIVERNRGEERNRGGERNRAGETTRGRGAGRTHLGDLGWSAGTSSF